MKNSKFKRSLVSLICYVILCLLFIYLFYFIVFYCRKIIKKQVPIETLHYFLYTHIDIDIKKIKKSIKFDSISVTGFFGNNILFDIQNKDNIYTLLRYPEFRNEILRHSKSNFEKYFKFLKLEYLNKNKKYILDFTGFHGYIDNKVFLWMKLKNKYGRKTANEIMGVTYLIPNDKKIFLLEHNANQKYILKNSFGGARSALEIIQKKSDILKYFEKIDIDPSSCEDAVCHSKVKYNMVQNFIEPTFLINGYKFGLRFFLILIDYRGKKSGHIFKDGYCYYSEEKYDKDSINLDGNVVGRVSKTKDWRKKNNLPESYFDFKEYVKKNVNDGEEKINNLEKKLKKYCNKIISSQSEKELFNFGKYKNVKSFCIYAMDVEIDSEFNPFIFEANVYFTRFNSKERLGLMVVKMYNDIFFKLELVPKEKVGMFKVY